MRNLPLIALLLLVSSFQSAFSQAFLTNLKTFGTPNEIPILVYPVDKNNLEITSEDLLRTMKLRLIKNGIKPLTLTPGLALSGTTVELITSDLANGGITGVLQLYHLKSSSRYTDLFTDRLYMSDIRPYMPEMFVSGQSTELFIRNTKASFMAFLEESFDTWILKYLEANME